MEGIECRIMLREREREREIELSQLLGRTAKLGTENQHDSSSKHGYNLCFMYSLVISLSCAK